MICLDFREGWFGNTINLCGSDCMGRRNQTGGQTALPAEARGPLVRTPAEETVQVLIDRIYDASFDPILWPGTLDLICDAVGGPVSANLFVFEEGEALAVRFMQSTRIDPDCISPYLDHYHKVDLWAQGVMKSQAKKIVQNGDLISPQAFEGSEWYGDFLTDLEIYHWLSSRSPMAPGQHSSLSFYRPQSAKDFDQDAHRLYSILAPHVYRSIQIFNRVSQVEHKANTLIATLGALPHGAVFLDGQGAILECTAVAQELLNAGDGLKISEGHLRALSPRSDILLQQAIGQAVGEWIEGGSTTNDEILIRRDHGQRDLQVLVAPLPKGTTPVLSDIEARRPKAVVILSQLGGSRESPAAHLQSVFGLTSAETRLALLIAQGVSLNDCAELCQVARGTARTQLKHIFSKTGVHRQAELVHLILTLRLDS